MLKKAGAVMTNSQSNFVRILREICEEEGISVESYGDDWIFGLSKDGSPERFVFGYQFGLNLASVVALCNDKAATYEFLSRKQIPAVEHLCFMTPEELKYVGKDGCFEEIHQLLQKYGTIVVKDNLGTGGMQVFRVSSKNTLEQTLLHLFTHTRSVAVSPYLEIAQEFRIVMLDGEPQIMFSKQRDCVVGDGVKSLRVLVGEAILQGRLDGAGEIRLHGAAGDRVPAVNEVVTTGWKHNLGQGAKPLVADPEEYPEELNLAKKAVAALGARFVSVDLVRTRENGCRIIEVNAGVMMENLAGTSDELYERVKEIYRKAVKRMFI